MKPPVLITGATGVLGREIVVSAVDSGLVIRQGARNPANANPAFEAVRFDYTDPPTIATALEGIVALVLMAPPLEAKAPELLAPVIAAAKAAKLQHIVFVSAFGVNHNEQAPLRVVEHMIIDCGVPYTIVRPNFFMENFSVGFASGSVREQNAIFLAAGDGKTSFISAKDIAAVVVAALRQAKTGIEVDLTGPAALDHTKVAQILSEATGQTIVYHSLTEEQMLDGARARGMPEPIVEYLGVLYGVVRAGYAAGVAPYPDFVGGRQPMTFESFAKSMAKGETA